MKADPAACRSSSPLSGCARIEDDGVAEAGDFCESRSRVDIADAECSVTSKMGPSMFGRNPEGNRAELPESNVSDR